MCRHPQARSARRRLRRPEYRIYPAGQRRLKNKEEFEDIILRVSDSGAVVRVRDVAQVELGQLGYTITGNFKNKPATVMAVYLLPGANALNTGRP